MACGRGVFFPALEAGKWRLLSPGGRGSLGRPLQQRRGTGGPFNGEGADEAARRPRGADLAAAALRPTSEAAPPTLPPARRGVAGGLIRPRREGVRGRTGGRGTRS